MKSILEKLVKRPVLICVVTILVIAFGIMSVFNMNVSLLPNMNMPFLVVNVVYPGAGSEDVERNVTHKLEEVVKTVSEVDSVTTYSIDNVSILTVMFNYSVNIDDKEDELKAKLENISLPKECLKPSVSTIDLNGDSVCTISLTYPSDPKKLVSEANTLKDLIYNINGVGEVNISGLPEYSINLRSLHGLDLTISMVAQSLANLNYDIPLGTIIQNNTSIAITNTSNCKTIEELKQAPISVKLNTQMWSMLEGIDNTLTDYNDCTIEDLDDKISKANDIKDFINEVEAKTLDELKELNDNLSQAKYMITLIRNNTSVELKMMYTQIIKPLSSDEAFLNATDEDLERISEKNGINKAFLKDIQTFSKDGSLESRWNEFVNLRKYYEDNELDTDNITYPEYLDTFLRSGFITIDGDINSVEYQNEYNDKLDKLEFCDKINTLAFNQIVSFKEDEETMNDKIPDSYYSALFYDTPYSEEFEIVALPQFINVVRQSTFEANTQIIRDFKLKCINENKEMTNSDFEWLFKELKFDEEPKFDLTLDVIGLIRGISYDEVSDNGLLVLPLEMLCHVNEITDIEIYSEYNGLYSLLIDVYAKGDSNITSITNGVKDIINNTTLQSNVYLLNDQAEFITDSIESVVVSMIIGAVLAVIVIFIFIGKVKTSLVVAITMPVSVLASIIMLWAQKVTLNMVSLGGLAVGIGMLVDNSIVVIESISTYRQKGYNAYESAVKGTLEVAGSLLASTLTTVCVFFPILFTSGLTKEIFADLSYAVIYSIVFSLIVALFIIPTLYLLLYRKTSEEKYEEKTGKLYNKIISFYDKILRKCLRHKVLVVILSFGVFILSTVLVLTSGFEFMPSVDKGLIEINCSYEINVNSEEARIYTLNTVNEINDNINDIDYISYKVGKLSQKDQSYSCVITIQLKDGHKKTTDVCQDLRNLISDNEGSYKVTNIDGVVANITSGMSSNGVTIMGSDYDTLKEASDKIIEKFSKIEGITQVSSNVSSQTTCYDFFIDKDKCSSLEVDYSSIVTLLRLGISGYEVASIKLDGNSDNQIISVEFNEDSKKTIDDILNVIIGYNEDIILLSDVVTYTTTLRPSVITRTDNLYSITISFEVYNVDTGTISNQTTKAVNEVLSSYKEIKSSSSGVMSFLIDAFSGLVVALIVSFFLLYGVMACQFESLSKPLIVIASIPLAFTGAFLGLFITSKPLDVVSFVGIIMLMGIVVNDAIVMVDKIDLNIESNMTMYDSIVEGAKGRFRAIWMTSLTTILALIPLALAIGRGSELMQPMGIVVIGGLLLSTCVTLILIPSLYAIIKKVNTK